MRYMLTDTEIKKLLKNIVILSDTKEQENSHIIDFFKKHRQKYKSLNLSEGDYSGYIEYNEETSKILESMNIHRNLYLVDEILIERKAHLDEIAGNLKQSKEKIDDKGNIVKNECWERKRFKFELTRAKNIGAKMYLFIEDPNGDLNIRTHNYRSDYTPKSFLASLKSIEAEYDVPIKFMDKRVTGSEIINTVKYEIRKILKGGDCSKLKDNLFIEEDE